MRRWPPARDDRGSPCPRSRGTRLALAGAFDGPRTGWRRGDVGPGTVHHFLMKTNPVDWFTGGCGQLADAWNRLDSIPNVGSKIASFLMRDLSFLRDRSAGSGGRSVSYQKARNAGWVCRLTVEDQALFAPIDIYVHRAARAHGAPRIIAKRSASEIQTDPDLHRQAATELVVWARKRNLDARDVDEYWYSLGAENIRRNGVPVD